MTNQDTSPGVEPDAAPAVELHPTLAVEPDPLAVEPDATSTVEPNAPAVDNASSEVTTRDEEQSSATGSAEADPSVTPALETRISKVSARSALEREGEVAADFLEQLLDIADMDGDIDVDIDGDRAAVAIVDSEEGRVSRRLVGPDGKVLEALQELTRLAVQAATGERSRLMLDVAGYRAERRAAVVTIAQAAIARVKSSNDQVAMNPMSAFERKVVHDEVLAAGLDSESEGVDPQRHVVILPA